MAKLARSGHREQYRADIDGLRSIAVAVVVLFHLGFAWMPGGFVGVDVFFVVSGFLITGLIVNEVEATGRFDYYNFYLRRLRRLGPALLFTLLVTSTGTVILFAPHDLQRYGASLFHAVISVSNLYFWTGAGYFDGSSETNILLHTWSLSVEEQFYMLWPVVLVTVLLRWGRAAALRVLLGLSLASFLLNLAFDDRAITRLFPHVTNDILEQTRAAVFFLTPFRVFELGIGAALAFPGARRAAAARAEAAFVLGLAMIAYAALTLDSAAVFPSYNALLPCLGTALILYANNPRYTGIVLRNRAAVWLGLRSYSLYLIHWPIIVFWRYWELDDFELSEQVAIVVLATLCAAAMYRFVEQPYRRRVKPAVDPGGNGRFVVVCALGAVMLLALGANEWGGRGWIWRLDERRQAVFEKMVEPARFHRDYYGGAECKPIQNCVLNRGRGRNVYFVGDSHMLQYAAGLATHFPELQFTHLSNRCRFNTLTLCYAGRWQTSPYVRQKAEQLQRLRDSGDLIVIGQAWYHNRAYYDPVARKEITFPDQGGYIDFLVQHLREVDAYFGPGRILVIGEVNRFGRYGDPLTCLGKPFVDAKCTRSPRSFAVGFNRQLGRRLAQIEIPFVDPTSAVCDAGGCLSVERGLPMYSDVGHLSVWGSRLIVSRHKEAFSSFLSGSRASAGANGSDSGTIRE